MKIVHFKFAEIFNFNNKSTFKAGEGLDTGLFPFYTSSSTLSKYLNTAQFNTPSLIFGTGGNASIHFNDSQFSVSTDCLVAYLKPEFTDSVETKFIYYYLYGNVHILELGFKGAGLKHISKEYIKNIILPIFPIEFQRNVIKILDLAQSLIEKRKQAILHLDDYIKAVFLDIFGDPVSNPKGWGKKQLNELGKVITGNTPPRDDPTNYSPRFIEWIKTDNIVLEETFITQATEYLSESGLSKARFVNPNSILVACIAGSIESIGRAGITDRKVSFNQQINAIEPNSDMNSLFFYWLLKMTKVHIQNHATNGMKRILTKGEFQKIKFIKPSFETQIKFSLIVNSVELLKQKMKSQLQELEDNFQVQLQRAFRGE
ncbi:MAG: restriction endonuclease subunit S [Bacteroidetes bacterium]|nr:restriction endonuclease subunit S [Bacteroidota bacterium]